MFFFVKCIITTKNTEILKLTDIKKSNTGTFTMYILKQIHRISADCKNIMYIWSLLQESVFKSFYTGELHLGGFRTALYNYLFAKVSYFFFLKALHATSILICLCNIRLYVYVVKLRFKTIRAQLHLKIKKTNFCVYTTLYI